MDLGLNGTTAFVAGASSGLGFAVARALASEGCRVAICSRSRDRIQRAADRIQQDEGEAIPVVCDVTSEEAIRAAFEQTASEFEGKLNILVTNAGGPPAGYVDDFDADDWHRYLDLNLVSTINLCRHALPLIRSAVNGRSGQEAHGRILMVTSVSAKQPIPSLYLSNTSRAGVQGFAKSLSSELGPAGITVNTVLPGYTDTERLAELAEDANKRSGQSVEAIYDDWSTATALKRVAVPAEFAAAVTFLAGKPASYITGHALSVDGGRVKSLF